MHLCLLIVEDEEAHIEAICRAYEEAGADVEIQSVGTLREFRASVQARPPDLVLMDLNLPDGCALEALTHPPEDAPFPVLMMTAFGSQQIVVEAMKAGALDYVVKSLEAFAAMPHTVERALREWMLLKQHKQVETALRESELKYRSLIECSSDAIFCVDVNGVYKFTNHVFASTLGKSPDYFVGKTFWDIYPKKHADCRFEATKRVFQTGKSESLEVEVPLPNQTLFFYATANPIKDETGKVILALTRAIDITARKQAEAYREMGLEVLQILAEPGDLPNSIQRVIAALKTRTGFDAVGLRLQDGDDFPYFAQQGFSEKFLLTENTLVGRAADGGVCRDKDGKVSLECACGLVISGKTDPSSPLCTRGGSFWTNDSIPLLDLPSNQDPRHYPRNQCIHHGYASMALVPIRSKDKIVGLIHGLIHINDRRAGRFTRETVELLEDIASHIGEALMRKQAEKREQLLNERLGEMKRLEMLGVLASGVAHDLNNIIGPMVALPDILMEELDDVKWALENCGTSKLEQTIDMDAMQESLRIIKESSERAAKAVADLSLLSQHGHYARVPLSLNDVIDNTARSNDVAVLKKLKPRVTLQTALTLSPAHILGSQSHLHRVFSNLIRNAFDAIEDHGAITIAMETVRLSAPYQGCEVIPPGDYVVIRVADTGSGIASDILPRIFEPYFSKKKRTQYTGSGLGLSIVLGIVKDHAGFVDVVSQVGQGTTFNIYLPPNQGAATLPIATPALKQTGKERILVVDDEPGQRHLVKRILIRQGYWVTTASDGKAAVTVFQKALERTPIDLLLLDMVMLEGFDGLVTLRAILDIQPGQKAIVTSGVSLTERVVSAQKLGCDWLPKPYTAEQLLSTVRNKLDSQALSSAV